MDELMKQVPLLAIVLSAVAFVFKMAMDIAKSLSEKKQVPSIPVPPPAPAPREHCQNHDGFVKELSENRVNYAVFVSKLDNIHDILKSNKSEAVELFDRLRAVETRLSVLEKG
jgi:hypothetical protein